MLSAESLIVTASTSPFSTTRKTATKMAKAAAPTTKPGEDENDDDNRYDDRGDSDCDCRRLHSRSCNPSCQDFTSTKEKQTVRLRVCVEN